MKTINVFGYDIKLKENSCQENGNCFSKKIDVPYVNLYVRIENSCNAKCPFCKFAGKKAKFDFYKFYYVLHEPRKHVEINKISFTGGEPTLNFCDLTKCFDLVKQLDKEIFTVTNTNGTRLEDLCYSPFIDSIALSRHHYNQVENDKIFGMKTPKLDQIRDWNINKNIHLSCNLIKGQIDNEDNLIEYLHSVSKYGIDDVGFVSLMNVNEFCNEHKIDFSDITFNNPDVLVTKE